jgi:hypothetical protein
MTVTTASGRIATIQHSQQLPHLSPTVPSCTLELGGAPGWHMIATQS